MPNLNGKMIMDALKTIQEPATVREIVAYVADVVGVDPKSIKQSVKDTLQGGMQYGYVQRVCNKYFAAPLDLDDVTDEDEDDDDDAVRRSSSKRNDSRAVAPRLAAIKKADA